MTCLLPGVLEGSSHLSQPYPDLDSGSLPQKNHPAVPLGHNFSSGLAEEIPDGSQTLTGLNLVQQGDPRLEETGCRRRDDQIQVSISYQVVGRWERLRFTR